MSSLEDITIAVRRGLIHQVPSVPTDKPQETARNAYQQLSSNKELMGNQQPWIKDEKAFRKTFGRSLDLGPRDRKALSELMEKYDLSEKTVWRLQLAGCVEQTSKGIEITAPGFIAAFGLTAMLITVLMVLPVWWLLPELSAQAETRLDAIVVSGVALSLIHI